MKLEYIFLFISFLFIIGLVNAYTISTLSINDDYTNDDSIAYIVSGTLSDNNGIIDNKIPLIIDSDKHTGSAIDFNADVSSLSFTAYFYIDLSSSSSSTENGWPKIVVNSSDTVIVQDNNSQSKSDTLIVDSLSPTLGTITSITALDTSNYNDYYSQDINVNFSAASDNETYIDHYIVYVVPVANISNYSEDYVDKEESDDNSFSSITISTDLSADGNYYILIDAVDIAGNSCDSNDVIETSTLAYFDNLYPTVSYFNLSNNYHDGNLYYVDSNNFYIGVKVVDSLSGVDINGADTKMDVVDPNNALINLYRDYNSDYNGFYHPINDSRWGDGNLFHVSLDVNDNVDNHFSEDFNIQIDAVSPTTPSKSSSVDFLSVDEDKNVTITWLASTDTGGSGVDYYEIYRSTSSFSSISGLTSIGSTTSLTYEDTSSKSNDQRYYYGVVAVDNVGNKSDPQTGHITTGPSLSIEINDGDTYTNDPTPDIEVTFSDDVNLIRFSCNDSSYTSWIEVSGTSETYSLFNIASSSYGCSSSDGKKTVYVEVKSEDDPYLISKDSDYIRYDSTSPTVPTNLVATEQTDGSIKLTWTASTDSGSGLDSYRIYYSTSDNVSLNSNYKIAYSESYIFSPNVDGNYYFKVSSLDEVGNESSLSSGVSGSTKRIGPLFTIDIIPHNDVNEVCYVGPGITKIEVTSDVNLLADPIIQLKLEDSSYLTLTGISKNDLTYILDYNFNTSGEYTLKVSGKNLENEEAISTKSFIVDANIPEFDVNYSLVDSNFLFYIYNYSKDIFRVQYLLNNNEELCLIENLSDYNCDFDSKAYVDGNYTVNILAYDKALNIGQTDVPIEINNVDELAVTTSELRQQVESKLNKIIDKIEIFENLLVIIDKDILDSIKDNKDQIISANNLYDNNNLISAKNMYNKIDVSLTEILDKLPEESIIKTKSISISYDNNSEINIYDLTTDENVFIDTNELYSNSDIIVDRNFTVQEIASQKYFSVSLEFKNNSDSEKEITIIEDIPKKFSSKISDIIFNKKIQVIADDPIIKYTLKIPANSSEVLVYKKKTPITDLDMITKFDKINFKNPIVLSGNVDISKIKIKKPANYRLLSYIGFGFLLIIFILIILSFIGINKKKKLELGQMSTKVSMNKYLGEVKPKTSIIDSKDKQDKKEDHNKEDDKNKKDSFDSNYEFIINAIKRTKRE